MDKIEVRLQAILEELQLVARKLYRLEVNTAVQEMNQVINLFEEYIQTVQQHYRPLQVDEVQAFNQGLQLMTECLANHDYILLADLIHHELCKSLNHLVVEA